MNGLTQVELDFYKYSTGALLELVREVNKIREAVEKCTGRPVHSVPETPVREEHSKDSPFDCLAVTKVEVFPKYNSDRKDMIHGLATVVINDQLTLKDLMICESEETGLYVGYPTNNYFPMTRQLREHIENCVLEMYNNITK